MTTPAPAPRRLPGLVDRHGQRPVMGLFTLGGGVVAIGVMAALAMVTNEPFVFPSLGPTAFLLLSAPLIETASPRSALGGHAIGALTGYLALVVFGLTDAGPAYAQGVTVARVGAAAVSLGLTSGLMVWARVPHPPAGATTLIVSLGVLTEPRELVVLMLGVVLLVAVCFVLNRVAGVPYPAWSPRPPGG